MIRGVFILFAAVAAFAAVPAKSFFVRPSADSLVFFRVDSIVVQNGDAFDDSKAYSWADSLVYRIGNTIHIETRESVVKKLVLFDVGDSVNLYELIESEKICEARRISPMRILHGKFPLMEKIFCMSKPAIPGR